MWEEYFGRHVKVVLVKEFMLRSLENALSSILAMLVDPNLFTMNLEPLYSDVIEGDVVDVKENTITLKVFGFREISINKNWILYIEPEKTVLTEEEKKAKEQYELQQSVINSVLKSLAKPWIEQIRQKLIELREKEMEKEGEAKKEPLRIYRDKRGREYVLSGEAKEENEAREEKK